MTSVRDQLQRFVSFAPPDWVRSLGDRPPGAPCPPGPRSPLDTEEQGSGLLPHLEAMAALPAAEARARFAGSIAELAVMALGGNARAEKALGCLAGSRTPWAGPVREINVRRRFFAELARTRGAAPFGDAVARFHRATLDRIPLTLLAARGGRIAIEPFLRERIAEIAWGPSTVIGRLFEERFGPATAGTAARVRERIVGAHRQTVELLSAALPSSLLAKFALRLSSAEGLFPQVWRHLIRVLFFAALEAIESDVRVALDIPAALRFREGFEAQRLAPIVAALVRDASLGLARAPCWRGAAARHSLQLRWEPLRRAIAIEDDGPVRPDASPQLRDRVVALGWGMSITSEAGKGTRVLLHPREGDLQDGASLPLFPGAREPGVPELLVRGGAMLAQHVTAPS